MVNIEDCFSFHKQDCIVIGCSTGPDSMALVDMLLKIRDKYDLSLIEYWSYNIICKGR